MKKVAISGALAGAFAVMASGASAQLVGDNPPVKIENNSGETRKVCFHKPKRVTLFAIGCVTLKDGENIFWDRKSEFTPFKVKIYKTRKLVDKYLYSRDLPGDTWKILIGPGARFGFSRFASLTGKYNVRACNTEQKDDVWFSIGFDSVWGMLSEGWWKIPQGECRTVDINDRMSKNWNLGVSRPPRVYYYARTYGDEPKFWNKSNLAKTFCINKKQRFTAKLQGDGACDANQVKSTYRYLSTPVLGKRETLELRF